MRFVIGVGGETASDSPLSIDVLDGPSVISMRDLAPEGVSAASGDASALERADIIKRFQNLGDNIVAVLRGHRALAFFSDLASEDGVDAMLIFDDPVAHIARRLSAGESISGAATDWMKMSASVLKSADDCRGRASLFSAADIARAPHAFSYFCENELGIRIGADARDTPLLEGLVAARFVAAHDEIREIEAELLVRCRSFGAPLADVQETSALALEKLRSLYDGAERAERVQKENALLGEQLRMVQHKAEIYYHKAQDSAQIESTEVARLTSELDHARHEIAALRNSASWKVSAPLRLASRLMRRGAGLKVLISEQRQLRMLKKSDLFDAQWYLKAYPDVAELRINPAKHYLRHGAKEGRSPSARFDSGKYLKTHPDVAATNANPLIHYIKFGRSEAREA